MKTTGIVRKIDDLGRIVIPKEIRNNMKLNIGSPLEIYVDGDYIIMKKFSRLLALQEIAKSCVDLIFSTYSIPCMITDDTDVVAMRGLPKGTPPISVDTDVEICVIKNQPINDQLNKSFIAILPISYNSELFGKLILLSDNDLTKTIEELKTLVSFIAIQLA